MTSIVTPLLVVVGALLFAAPVAAQVDLSLTLSPSRIELGDQVRVELKAMAGSDEPSSPRLELPPGFSGRGPSVGSQQQVSITNGRIQRSVGISATWVIVPSKTGRFTIGPATVVLGGRTYASRAQQLEVVAQGTLPKRRSSGGRRRLPFGGGLFDPFDFDPFGGSNFPDLDNLLEEQAEQLQFPPELAVERPLDPTAFLRATVTPENAVIGQQVTLRVYAYNRNGPASLSPLHTPKHPDFFSIDHTKQAHSYRVRIGEDIWFAEQIHEVALFPLRAGTLEIEGMEVEFASRRRSGRQSGLVRKAPNVQVSVREPAIQGRPAGYQLGDVGSYELSAQVAPRQVNAGDSISVVAKLQGTGNVPRRLITPEKKGADWLEPTITSDITFDGDEVSGSRAFTYVVRLSEPGQLDLGELLLPYYDPQRRRYAVARANLGQVQVLPGKGQTGQSEREDAEAQAAVDLGKLVEPRRLGARHAQRAFWTDRPAFWVLLFSGPLGVAFAFGAVSLGRDLAQRRREKKNSLERQALLALKAARTESGAGKSAEALSALERALYTAIEAGTGLKARAVIKQELASRLVEAGVDESLAEQVSRCLQECDTLRFSKADPESLGELLRSAQPLVRRLVARRIPATTEEAQA